MSAGAHYVLVGRIATVVVVVLGFAWLPIMMKMDTLYNYLQGIQSLLAPAMVAVFAMGIFFKKITPKSGEYAMITGFLIGMLRLVTNVITDTGKATMDGAFWDYTAWFWQTNWLVFECWLLVFLIIFMVVVSCFTPAPSKEQVEAITFTSDFKKSIRERLECLRYYRYPRSNRPLRSILRILLVKYYSRRARSEESGIFSKIGQNCFC